MIEDEKVWSAEWGKNILFSHGSAHSRGVCILQNPCSTSVRLCSISTDSEGRLIIAKVTIENKPFFILNIYTPTDYRDRDNFIKTISEHLASKSDTSKVIISGDWNITLNPIDKSGGQPWKATNYRNALVSLMEEMNLVDVYRQLHPTTKSFTYESKPLKVRSRIDFFPISCPLSNHVRKTETRNSIAPDHKSIYLNLEIKNEFKRGNGLWKFNNTLLEDKHYKEFVTIKYPQILEKYSEVTEKQLLWELIKMELRFETIKYSKEKRFKLRNKEEDLQSKLQELDHKICNGGVFDHQLLEQYEAAKEELKIIHETRGKEAMFRSKVKWFEQGEKPTKYFFNLEKTNYEKKLIREVKLENGETVTDEVQVKKEIEAFYQSLYTSKFGV